MKEKINEAIRTYFVLVTLITILLLVLGTAFDGDRTFSYEAFISPLFYAAIGIIPGFFLGSDRELPMKKLLLRNFIELFLIEAIVLIIAVTADSVPTERKEVVVGIAVGIVIVYVLTIVVEYIFEFNNSQMLNEALLKYQETDTEMKN